MIFKGFLGAFIALGAYLYFNWAIFSPELSKSAQIEQVFLESWLDYKNNAWGADVYGPISRQNSNIYGSADKPLGWIIVDTIDTLMLMQNSTQTFGKEFDEELQDVENWVANVLDYDIDVYVSVFETTIRMLGGLLSAHYLSNELKIGNSTVYLEKAIDLADRLMPAFETPTGIPYSSINLHTGEALKNHVDDGASSTAEFTTLQLEFKHVSFLTGDNKYWLAAEKVYKPLYEENDLISSFHGLVPIYTYPDSAKFRGTNIRLGSRGDSFYEYLLKQYLQTKEQLYYDLYRESMEGVKKYLVSHSRPNNLVFFGEREHGLYNYLSPKMDHLVCFMGGLLGMGATEGHSIDEARHMPFWDTKREEDWNLAQDLTFTCYQMYNQTPSGLAPEIVVFNANNAGNTQNFWQSARGDFFVKPLDKHNLQRPETVESIMFLYHLTGQNDYRTQGWEIFEAFRKHSCVDCGTKNRRYTSLADGINVPTQKSDNLESFWLAETLKYIYLLFQDNVDLTSVVFNTEAHLLPVLTAKDLAAANLKTGWEI
ncbi:LAMI_0C00870g1_1 [Lachancea mirantina]|uniref:alpha-1,2-Mannosidase n=1 Tax=Lachancea mirantina TaxID=1230905 RepID=A0A1G4J0E7_9SACH|nr:LAMI_0C00870g1_1 [Lachancea mirantina]